jgi:hypothetical protein
MRTRSVRPTARFSVKPISRGSRVRAGKRGLGIVVELNDRDKEALVKFDRLKKELWYRVDELEPVR